MDEKFKEDCIFCKIIKGKIPADIVYQDEKIIVLKDINPIAKVHLLVVPKKHVDSLNNLTKLDSELITHMVLKLKPVAEHMGLKGYRTIINTGIDGGQEVFHLHFHLLGKNLNSQ